MKRQRVDLAAIAAFDNLVKATVLAAKGKRQRPAVALFLNDLEANIGQLSQDILNGHAPRNQYRVFTIFDPKIRLIYAPCFYDRVVHHAIIALAGPQLEATLVPSSYACRKGKGNLAAVYAAQSAMRRFPWFVKIDIRGYFDNIDKQILRGLLIGKLKGIGLYPLLDRILDGYETQPGKGLPIGALTSQYFANLYLDGFDRFLLEELGVSAHVRFMDDIIWWCSSREQARLTHKQAESWLFSKRVLHIKNGGQINRSQHGCTFCGFRIFPGILLLSRRRKKRYVCLRRKWEKAFQLGLINGLTLQAGFSAVHVISLHAASLTFRRRILAVFPPPQV